MSLSAFPTNNAALQRCLPKESSKVGGGGSGAPQRSFKQIELRPQDQTGSPWITYTESTHTIPRSSNQLCPSNHMQNTYKQDISRELAPPTQKELWCPHSLLHPQAALFLGRLRRLRSSAPRRLLSARERALLQGTAVQAVPIGSAQIASRSIPLKRGHPASNI